MSGKPPIHPGKTRKRGNSLTRRGIAGKTNKPSNSPPKSTTVRKAKTSKRPKLPPSFTITIPKNKKNNNKNGSPIALPPPSFSP